MPKTIILCDDNKYNKRNCEEFDNNKLYNKLLIYKNKIDQLPISNLWDKAKKLGNDYELIYLPNKKNKYDSIASEQPLSRSYFKLWEIIHDFNLLNDSYNYNILCLAEGPGGFIEAINNYRKKQNKVDTITGITLKSINKDIPGWKKSNKFLIANKNVKITYGSDNTGNLYNINNIIYLKNKFNNSDFITADGGFDFSNDFNNQEELSYRIIFCEIVTALSTQKEGGTFICKIFDSHSIITIKFLYLLYSFYEEVYITKPYTSRPANSEKYIVCKKFKTINNAYLNLLTSYIKNWDYYYKNKFKYFLSFIELPYIFFKRLYIYNNILTTNQINNIEKTLSFINVVDKQIIENITKKQTKKALTWCKTYSIEINKFSSYITLV
jgi:23S rRNA U2552 (ribose-2'-O)-methylase RlmE/FtsJ